MNGDAADRAAIHDELERVRATIHELVASATAAEMRRPSARTRWTNQQLLFHMVFGYMVVRALRGERKLPLPHQGASGGCGEVSHADY